MRFSDRLKRQAIPQWEDCYINYKNLKVILKLVKSSANDRIEFQKSIFRSQIGNQPYIPTNFTENQLIVAPQSKEHYQNFKSINEKANILLFETLSKQIQLFGFFLRSKLKQIQDKFVKAVNCGILAKQDDKTKKKMLLPYLQYLFVQAFNLSQMYETNTETERRILLKHQLYSYGYYSTPTQRISQQIQIASLQRLIRQIQDYYIKVSGERVQKCRRRVRQLASQRVHKSRDSLIIGIMIGVFIGVCIFLASMLIYLKNQVQTDPIFNGDFPTWRGITLFIMYIWALGINLHHYEKYNINYRNVMEYNYTKYPTSKSFFKVAGFFSAILVILFTIYALDVADVIQVRNINPQWLALFVWGPFILFLINPVSVFYYKSRSYIIKLLFRCLISFAVFVTYAIVYATDQFVSLFTPFQDTVYTLCYYIHMQQTQDNSQILQQNHCKHSASLTIFIFSIIIFAYRIMQCIKCGLQVRPYDIRCFFNGLKYTVALVSTILSYVLDNNRERIFPAWLVFAILTSVYTFYWDIKYDWLLLERNSQHKLLRDRISYPQSTYYVLMVINLFLRCSWALTLSPNIVRNFLGSPQVFILLFSFLEIWRRGIWNMLSVEAEHYKNCNSLSASPNQYYRLDKQIEGVLLENKDKIAHVSVDRLIETESYITEWNPPHQLDDPNRALSYLQKKIEANKLKDKETKKYIRESNCHDKDFIQYLFADRYQY